MKAKTENVDDKDLKDFLEALIKQKAISGAMSNIATQVMEKGVESMKSRQKAVVERFLSSYKRNNSCDTCKNENVTSLLEYLVISEKGKCPTCEKEVAE